MYHNILVTSNKKYSHSRVTTIIFVFVFVALVCCALRENHCISSKLYSCTDSQTRTAKDGNDVGLRWPNGFEERDHGIMSSGFFDIFSNFVGRLIGSRSYGETAMAQW